MLNTYKTTDIKINMMEIPESYA